MRIILRLPNGEELWPYEDEPTEFGLNLPRHLFVVGCGGCSKAGRALINKEGVELFRDTWPDESPEEEYDAKLAEFYERVKAEATGQ